MGNKFRGDDGAAPLVHQQLKAKKPNLYDYYFHHGDPSTLINLWKDKNVIVLDAIDAKNLDAGTILEINPYDEKTVTWENQASSSHALSLDTALKLSHELNCEPATVKIYGVVGKIFSIGSTMSPQVARACENLFKLLAANPKEL